MAQYNEGTITSSYSHAWNIAHVDASTHGSFIPTVYCADIALHAALVKYGHIVWYDVICNIPLLTTYVLDC